MDLNEDLDKIYKKLLNEPAYGMTIKMVNVSDNQSPNYTTAGASGFDIRAFIEEPIVLQPLERRIIPTGLFFEIPIGFELQVRPRSGMAAKHGVTVLNSPGTIDSDYRGEVGVILVNLSNEVYTIQSGDRICQGVFAPSLGKPFYKMIEVDNVDEFSNTERGEGGFGSTGTK
jgi:dUTP pyrophosphatase